MQISINWYIREQSEVTAEKHLCYTLTCSLQKKKTVQVLYTESLRAAVADFSAADVTLRRNKHTADVTEV